MIEMRKSLVNYSVFVILVWSRYCFLSLVTIFKNFTSLRSSLSTKMFFCDFIDHSLLKPKHILNGTHLVFLPQILKCGRSLLILKITCHVSPCMWRNIYVNIHIQHTYSSIRIYESND